MRPTQTTQFFHVTNRGNARGEIFSDERDYAKFLKWLAEVVPRFGWRCHSYCLIPNHYHLLLETRQLNLGDGMLVLNGSYARWFNHRHDRVGHVFQGPYRPEPVEDEPHFLECCRYIAVNPVRAGLCTDPADWRWSSYRALAGLEHHPPYLTVELVRGMLGSAAAYAAFVAFQATSCNQVA